MTRLPLLFSSPADAPFAVPAGEVIGLLPDQLRDRQHLVKVVDERPGLVVVRTLAAMGFKAGFTIRLLRPPSVIAKAVEEAAKADALRLRRRAAFRRAGASECSTQGLARKAADDGDRR